MKKIIFSALICAMASPLALGNNLPDGFVYLKDVDSTIIQDMRYMTSHNFVGRPIQGYHAAECILTQPAANALHHIQMEIKSANLSLKVFDCYRPQTAVNDFIAWSKLPSQQQMKAEFYPRVNKADFFKLGYVAAKSGHTRGSTVDLTIVEMPGKASQSYHSGQKLISCFDTYAKRFHDSGIDMGTGFDCMDQLAHPDNVNINFSAYNHRFYLQDLMKENGFVGIPTEWWHFTLKDEPFPDTYFDFSVDTDATPKLAQNKH